MIVYQAETRCWMNTVFDWIYYENIKHFAFKNCG